MSNAYHIDWGMLNCLDIIAHWYFVAKEQKVEAGDDNSDVCLAYFFISHTFR